MVSEVNGGLRMPGSEKEYKYWGRLASTFHQDNLYVTGVSINQAIKSWLVQQFNEGDVVLEMGCGTGFYSEMVIEKVKQLIATDLAPEMIEQAKRHLAQSTNVEVQREDCYNTSFEDNAFDAVLMTNLLHIVMDPLTVLTESRRVLKDNGRIVIVDVTGYGMKLVKKMALGLRFLKRYGRPCSYSRNLRTEELVGMVRGAGFLVEDCKLIGKDTKAVYLSGMKVK
jgi:ubiquinone/menaquinone biosynthesis C-methylase UbiE